MWELLLQDGAEKNKTRFDAAIEITKAITGGLGTVATVLGGVVLYLNFKNANKNTQLIESRLITERLSKAFEQLGHDKIEVRLGGIYSLERIAQDSERDHWTIMEVLTSFISGKSPYISTNEGVFPNVDIITQDVQAALTVIGRRECKNDPPGKHLDFNQVNLCGADLARGNFARAYFYFVNLTGSSLHLADLNHSVLHHTELNSSALVDANLSFSTIVNTDINKAILDNADFSHSKLIDINFTNSEFKNTNFVASNLKGVTFQGATGLEEEQLKSAKLCNTIMPDGTINNRDCP